MGSEEIGDSVFSQRNGTSILNCCSSMMATDSISDNVAGMSVFSESMFESPSGVDPFYSSGWNTMVSGNQTESYLENFSMAPQTQFAHPHYPVVLENQTMGSSSDLVHFTSDSGLVDMVPKIRSFGSGSLSEMVSSFGHKDESGFHSNFPQNVGIQRASMEHGVLGALPNVKRKRKVPATASCKNVEVDDLTDQTEDSSEYPKADEKKNKNIGANSGSKKTVKQAKDNSNGTESSKENYILVRAKRGQATNSHSLAERVRRERISERMRLLQELVPGCNKVTGKAVMLDEIINYVQSLQQQVEFLSMKLATVNPELNVDIEQILSKDLLYPRRSNATALGIGLELSSSHTFPGFPQGTIDCLPGTAPPLPQNLWNNELQSILQMGLDSDPSISSLHENGLSERSSRICTKNWK